MVDAHYEGHKENAQRTFANTRWKGDAQKVNLAVEQVLQIVDEWQQHVSPWQVELLFWLTILFDVDAVGIKVAFHCFE